ncbi:MAG TPA: dCTP deaminase [Candidatus Latescibacteria bacterium]|nr:dCTP deaminase [Candidatus Latescibacterota bacterium]
MGLKPDAWILRMCRECRMIEPFEERLVRWVDEEMVISYGLSSFGYDIRIADEFKVFSPGKGKLTVVDPKNFDADAFTDFRGGMCIIPPNSFVLARSMEYFHMPQNVMGIVIGKSTYARCGIIVNITPLEPGWEGNLTIEISNTTPLPAKIYAGEGIAQVLFFQGDEVPLVTYADRKGKYQGQRGIVLPRA